MSVVERFGNFVLLLEALDRFKNIPILHMQKNGQALLAEGRTLAENLMEAAGRSSTAAPSEKRNPQSLLRRSPADTEGILKKSKTRRSQKLTAGAWACKQANGLLDGSTKKQKTPSGGGGSNNSPMSALQRLQMDVKRERSPHRRSDWRPVRSVPGAPVDLSTQKKSVEREDRGQSTFLQVTSKEAEEKGKDREGPSSDAGRPTDQEDIDMYDPSGEETPSFSPVQPVPVMEPMPMMIGRTEAGGKGKAKRRREKQQRKRERQKEVKHHAEINTIQQARGDSHQTNLGASLQGVSAEVQVERRDRVVVQEDRKRKKEK
uniref:Uncharacterized protein n=1 Tax=Chromera velia CCMP2878 TaxID=1169474 RepID=A0A0G4GQ06_9ALVE|eukprot:Cvel_22885.t1-p1 / transcript=Cvel_22885.t1 / gene=Cvel_22885 / organism=Chromera_velia_CCMP2878 / gene_product=hypothetical protein / transcript_product=hypothetical protein / location=Cvel_scaffold2298:26989-27939(+) / protein_length=317 / sequence_SO=supercontig / SO=protein_coding / is_pseudo=false